LRFWDASAVVPLFLEEATTGEMRALAGEDPATMVWWATEIECASSIARLERHGALPHARRSAALEDLAGLVADWAEVGPSAAIRQTALRLLRVHPLRAADALQLAAAIAGAEGNMASLELVTLDDRLADAARREGFVVRGV